MPFLELQCAIFFFAPLASLMRDLALGAAQKNPCTGLYLSHEDPVPRFTSCEI